MHPALSTWHHESEAPPFYLGNSSSSLPIPTPEGVNLVPSRSILGPMVFLIYVTNLPDSVLTSHVAMFADDTKIYTEQIKSREDAAYLQADLLAG